MKPHRGSHGQTSSRISIMNHKSSQNHCSRLVFLNRGRKNLKSHTTEISIYITPWVKIFRTQSYLVVKYNPLWKYWNSKANLLFLLCTEDIWVWDQTMNITQEVKILAFVSLYLHQCLKQLRTWHLFGRPLNFSRDQKYWYMWLIGVSYCWGIPC